MRTILLGLACMLGLAGCTPSETAENPKEAFGPQEPLKKPPPPPTGPQNDLPYPRGGRVEIAETENGAQLKERVKAQVGVGAKGRDLEDDRMVKTIVTPAIALFRTRERIIFEIDIPNRLKMYEALNGKKPQTHQEFFEQIIEAGRIQLPQLPPGQRYVYDPKKGELQVERPAR